MDIGNKIKKALARALALFMMVMAMLLAAVPAHSAAHSNRLANPIDALDQINAIGTRQYVKYAGDKIPLVEGTSGLTSVSHIQSYARYHIGNGNYYHIFSQSNVYNKNNSNTGFLYFISEQNPADSFVLKMPGSEVSAHNKYYNHPGGIQVIGDYLVVGVVPADGTSIGGSPRIYAVNLSKLKDNNEAPTTADVRLIADPNLAGAMSVGIVDLGSNFRLAGEDDSAINTAYPRYMLSIITEGEAYIYVSDGSKSFWDSYITNSVQYHFITSFGLEAKYESSGLFLDTDGHIYMIGMFTGPTNSDHIHLYRLTSKDSNNLIRIAEHSGSKKATSKKNVTRTNADGSIIGETGVHFKWGAGYEILDGKLIVYASEKMMGNHAQGNWKATLINSFDPPLPVAELMTGWYTIHSPNGHTVYAKGKDNRSNLVLGNPGGDIASPKFYFEKLPNQNAYRILAGSTFPSGIKDKYIEEGKTNGDIQLYEWSENSNNKLWIPKIRTDGLYSFENKSTGEYISFTDDKHGAQIVARQASEFFVLLTDFGGMPEDLEEDGGSGGCNVAAGYVLVMFPTLLLFILKRKLRNC